MTASPSGEQSYRLIYCTVAFASLLLSAWAGYVQYVPNPDAMLYLRAAELFSAGRWKDGYSIYQWPFYSLSIAAIIAVTNVKAIVAAQTVNALLDCLTAITFVALVRRLATDEQRWRIVVCAVFIVLLHPRLLSLRPVVIRDHGLYAFFLLTIYSLVRDHQQPRYSTKFAIACAIVIAGLFRLEAFFLFLLVPAFYFVTRASSSLAILGIGSGILLVSTLLIPGYAFWTSAYLVPHANSSGFLNDILARLPELFRQISERTDRLTEMLPPGRSVGVVAYIGITIAVTIDVALRALTYPLAALAICAFTPKLLLTTFATRLVAWFAGWQLPLLLTFMTFAFFVDWRYAMAFAIVLTVPAVFTLNAVFEEWNAGFYRARYTLPAVILAVAVPGALAFPLPSSLGHLQEAGYWVDKNLPNGAKILTNDGRIAYYIGRPYEKEILTRSSPETIRNELGIADYAVIDAGRDALPNYFAPEIESRLITTIKGAKGRQVRIYKLR